MNHSFFADAVGYLYTCIRNTLIEVNNLLEFLLDIKHNVTVLPQFYISLYRFFNQVVEVFIW